MYRCIFRKIHSMIKYFTRTAIMHQNAAVISVTCILLCLTFNYTFPLHRGKWNPNSYNNLSMTCDETTDEQHGFIDRPKKKALSFENALKRIKESTQDLSKNFRARFNNNQNSFTEEDLRHYEKLVIMKKNPYIDLKDIELKFSPTDKNTRQSIKFVSGLSPQIISGEPSFWEPMEDGPNVEIINRGLTGFAIPAKIPNPKVGASKIKGNYIKTSEDIIENDLRRNSNQNPHDY